MEYVGQVPAPPLDRFIDDIYCLTGVPRYRRMNVPATETLRVLEQELRSRLAGAPSRGLDLVQHTGGRLETSHGAVPVGALTDAAGVSGNHLATQFKSHVGVTPKRVARIYRFARLILSVDARRPVGWSELAQAAGYFDQAHFSKEFKDFTGHTRRNTWPCGADSPPCRGSRRTAVRCPPIDFLQAQSPPGRQDRGRMRKETRGEQAMGTVIMHNVVSVDGFIADKNDDVGPLHDWYLFDLVNGWEGQPPAGDHVVVVSHRPKPEGWHPEASYHFVDSVTAAIDKAQELAGDRTVAVNAGEVGSQILAAGLVDEVAMDVVPVVFGSGKRYFGSIDRQHLLEDPHVVIQGDRVLHLRFKVRR